MLFLHGKARSLYFQRKKAASLAWTTTYRRAHKKDQTGEATKRRRRNLHSKQPRAIGNLTIEVRSAGVARCLPFDGFYASSSRLFN
jgi:large subunit ribosomal protein L24e